MKNPSANRSIQQNKSWGCIGSDETSSLSKWRFIRTWLVISAPLDPPNVWLKRRSTVMRGGCEQWPQSSAGVISSLPWYLNKTASAWQELTNLLKKKINLRTWLMKYIFNLHWNIHLLFNQVSQKLHVGTVHKLFIITFPKSFQKVQPWVWNIPAQLQLNSVVLEHLGLQRVWYLYSS